MAILQEQTVLTSTSLSTTPATAETTSVSRPVTPSAGTDSGTSAQPDQRIKLEPLAADFIGSSRILQPLIETNNALIFPYTPSINVVQGVDYAQMAMTHSNQDYYSYARTPNVTISINGKFTVQNGREGAYAMAAIHMLRSLTKMHFGERDEFAGLPPTVCLLSGYGVYNFNRVRTIVKGHNFNFDENMDMVTVTVNNNKVRLPALFTLNVELTVQQTGREMRKQFSLNDYKDGTLLERGGFF